MAVSKGALETASILAPCFQTGTTIGGGWRVENVEMVMNCSFHMLVITALIK